MLSHKLRVAEGWNKLVDRVDVLEEKWIVFYYLII